MSKEKNCQIKIHNLEKQLPRMLDRVHDVRTVPAVSALDFNETRRRKFKDGYYMVTIQERGNESHGVIIEKRTGRTGAVSFYLFDPNGQRWANVSSYSLSISFDRQTLGLMTSISPKVSWNPMGYCGLWTAVMVIFFSNVRQHRDDDKPFPKSHIDKFYDYLDEHHDTFINDIYSQLIVDAHFQYETTEQAALFIDAVIGKITKILARA